ncbi:MAG: hypothetical protein P4M11_14655 [Candidatus Pacebacteria bacterium]|nr:hypothetical protein [Candidatus Paceibacterota bacterium]
MRSQAAEIRGTAWGNYVANVYENEIDLFRSVLMSGGPTVAVSYTYFLPYVYYNYLRRIRKTDKVNVGLGTIAFNDIIANIAN